MTSIKLLIALLLISTSAYAVDFFSMGLAAGADSKATRLEKRLEILEKKVKEIENVLRTSIPSDTVEKD